MVQCSTLYWWWRYCLRFLFFRCFPLTRLVKTVSTLKTFFFLMTVNPSVQEKAQADIDRVAPNRLPTLDDYDSLPYIRAIKEVMRWGPVAPLGFFCIDNSSLHLTFAFIKQYPTWQCKMTYMITITLQKGPRFLRISGLSSFNFFVNPFLHSSRAMTHDEEIYPDSFTFNPGRHLGDDAQPDPYKFVFGFGRRACPGMYSPLKRKPTVYCRGPFGRNVLISECIEYLGRLQHLKASGWAWSWSRADAGLDNGVRYNVGHDTYYWRAINLINLPFPGTWSLSSVAFNLVRRNALCWSAHENRNFQERALRCMCICILSWFEKGYDS